MRRKSSELKSGLFFRISTSSLSWLFSFSCKGGDDDNGVVFADGGLDDLLLPAEDIRLELSLPTFSTELFAS